MEALSATKSVRRVAPLIVALALPVLAGCGRAGGKPDQAARAPEQAVESAAAPVMEQTARVEQPSPAANAATTPAGTIEALRKAGLFAEFVDAALNEADQQPDDPALQLLKAEALLAVGTNDMAETAAERSAQLALDRGEHALATQALRHWVTARFRRGQPLSSASIAGLLGKLPDDEPGAETLRFWMRALADKSPYLSDNGSLEPAVVPATQAAEGTIWADLNAVEVRGNGAALPMVFIDSGAQQSIMTQRAAEMAGVDVGQSATQLAGFAEATARPAVLRTLELGTLLLHDVPVLVANSPPLMAAKGQMTLGTDLMHHVRFTLDYPQRRVLAARADQQPPVRGRSWDIPVWTFSQACLAQGVGSGGRTARVMLDTGNRTGTYVSARWAQRNLARFQRPDASLIFKFRRQGLTLDTMDLGSSTLPEWPILDRMPAELERLNLVDVLLGHDLFGAYCLSIDLRQRVLHLQDGPDVPRPTTAPQDDTAAR